MGNLRVIFLACMWWNAVFLCTAGNINICDYGAVTNDRSVNTTTVLNRILKEVAGNESARLFFPKGEYHFYVDSVNHINTAFVLDGLKNLEIDGNGSEFIFHGPLIIGNVTSCENIKFDNFSIDWERPYITQGVVKELGEDYIDLSIDKEAYPYKISEQDSVFKGVGENWELGIATYNLYDKANKEIVYLTRDMPMGDIFTGKSREISSGVVRFFGKRKYNPEPGTYVALWHGRYMTDGFYLYNCKDVRFENINIYHCPSHGLVGVRSENISISNMNMKVNESKGRVFSLIADAFHFNACKGLISVENCEHTGHGDDFINVHGMYVKIEKILDEHTFQTGYSERQNMTIDKGDELWFIKSDKLERNEVNRIKSIEKRTTDNGQSYRIVTLEKAMSRDVKAGDFVENKSYVADFTIRNCRILKKHRARGILVTTPGKVLIENNYFRTAGAAILIEGDTNYWYESGGCENVQIRNNIFEDCFTSGPEWGEAVITVTPSCKPVSDTNYCYHRNISIEHNIFKHYDYGLIYARSVKNLHFKDNIVQRTWTYKPFVRKVMFYLDGCKGADFSGNIYGNDVLGLNIETYHMKKEDVISKDKVLNLKNN